MFLTAVLLHGRLQTAIVSSQLFRTSCSISPFKYNVSPALTSPRQAFANPKFWSNRSSSQMLNPGMSILWSFVRSDGWTIMNSLQPLKTSKMASASLLSRCKGYEEVDSPPQKNFVLES